MTALPLVQFAEDNFLLKGGQFKWSLRKSRSEADPTRWFLQRRTGRVASGRWHWQIATRLPGSARILADEGAGRASIASGGGMRQDDYLPLLHSYVTSMQARAATGEVGFSQTPDEVAEAVLAVLADPNPPVRLRTFG